MILRQFTERSFPLEPGDFVRINPPEIPEGKRTARTWLASAHEQLRSLLPEGPSALHTDELILPSGQPVDVFRHFGIKPEHLPSLRHNWNGLAHTAQSSGASTEEDKPTPPWPGFEDVSIPVVSGVEIRGRMAHARCQGEIIDADCIVILPGILGDNNVLRTRDLAQALVASGFHVMALELRGHGETARCRPDVFYNFCTLESLDLLLVSRWLEARPHVRRAGLIGFCWGANHALLAAWMDGSRTDHPSIRPKLASCMETQWALGRGEASPTQQPGSEVCQHKTWSDSAHWTAGVIAFSPVLRFEELIEAMESRVSRFRHPALAGLQDSIESRMKRRGYPNPSGSLLQLIREEISRTSLGYPEAPEDSIHFTRFLPRRDKPDHAKLESARVPVLIVHGANDPLAKAQDVADLIARTKNPNVAALILPGGGHIGFAAYAKAYYYSLILNYFGIRA